MTIHNALAALAIRSARTNNEPAVGRETLSLAVAEFNSIVGLALDEHTTGHGFAVNPSASSLREKVLPLVSDILGLSIEKAGREKVIVLDREAFEASRGNSAVSAQVARDALLSTFLNNGGTRVAGREFNRRGLAVVTAEDLVLTLGGERYGANGRSSAAYKAMRASLKALAIECADAGNDAFECTTSLEGRGSKAFAVYADFFDGWSLSSDGAVRDAE